MQPKVDIWKKRKVIENHHWKLTFVCLEHIRKLTSRRGKTIGSGLSEEEKIPHVDFQKWSLDVTEVESTKSSFQISTSSEWCFQRSTFNDFRWGLRFLDVYFRLVLTFVTSGYELPVMLVLDVDFQWCWFQRGTLLISNMDF